MNHKTTPSRSRANPKRLARYTAPRTAMTAPCNKTEEPQLPAGRPNHHDDHWHNSRARTLHTSTHGRRDGLAAKLDMSSFRSAR
ncbi:hypothetical protein MTO96_022882 [Rhipicephalus appendiculatus]